MKNILLFLFIGLNQTFAVAQQNLPLAKRNAESSTKYLHSLNIGEQLPDISVNLINFPVENIKISKFRGKTLILDFWGTFCSSCLEHFPMEDSLQNEFKTNIQILLVDTKSTRDTREKIQATLKRFGKSNGSPFNLPSVINDTTLDRLFPHFSLPHFVWIDKDGIVKSFTAAEELTHESIVQFLKNEDTFGYQKIDFDPKRPLYTSEILPTDHLQEFSMLLKGKIDGIGGGGLRIINDTTRGVILHNRSLLRMYQSVIFNKIPGFSDNRLILDVKDSSKFLYVNSKQSKDQWERANFYSYELIVPVDQFNTIYDDVLEDLNRYTPYIAEFKKEKINCWILQISESGNITPSKGGDYFYSLDERSNPRLNNGKLIDLCSFINKITGNGIILDETGYEGNLDLNFEGSVNDPQVLQKKLKAFGLRLFQADREVNMLVIKDKL